MVFLNEIAQPVWFAVFGAFSIKLLEIAELYKLPKIERSDLKDWLYWVPFIILPAIGGGLAQMYVSSNTILSPMLAVNVGVSAPLILRALAQVNPLEANSIQTPDDA